MRGRILSCVGGMYTVETESADTVRCYAKGTFRHEEITPVAGDYVEFSEDGTAGREIFGYITKISDRKNCLIRPPVANIDKMFAVFALANPLPSLIAIDKLCSVACHNDIEVSLVFTKKDIESADRSICDIYRACGYSVFEVCAKDTDEVRDSILCHIAGVTAVFAGPSGVGKSTIVNALYPDLKAKTGNISEKNRRGRHTTRETVLYHTGDGSYLADTPGFTLLDFSQFQFMKKDELVWSFPEYEKYIGNCRYTKCTHTSEEGCAIVEAVKGGDLEKTRHESYVSLYHDLSKFKPWEKNKFSK